MRKNISRGERVDGDSTETAQAGPERELTFSIIIPTYNEEESIEETIDEIYEASVLPVTSFEIIVADESTDRTPSVVRDIHHSNVRLLRFDEHKGLAGSVIEGFNASAGSYVGVIDADGQHPAGCLFDLFDHADQENHDLVIASRYVDNGGIKNWSLFRKLVSVGATTIAQGLLLRNRDVQDPLSGFFVVHQTVFDGLTLNPVGYKILLELLVKSNSDSVAEIGYVFHDRAEGESNLTLSSYLEFLIHICKLTVYSIRR